MRYNIIFLEGVRKMGKTSQAVVLTQEFGKTQKVGRFNFDLYFDAIELNDKINQLRQWCQENPAGVALVTGSVSYSIIKQDLVMGKYGSSYPAFEIPLKNFYNLLREFKVINILMKSNSYNYLESRYGEDKTFNAIANQKVYEGFLYFEHSNIACNFKWETVLISEFDSILRINEKLKKVLE